MTTTATQGRATTLRVEWFEFIGGPASAVTGVAITVTSLAGGAPVVGPTTVGVTQPGVGNNTYVWNVPAGQATGDYLVTWTGTDPEGDTVQAAEVVTVLSSTATTGPCETWTPTFTCALPTGASAVSGAALQAATEVLYALSGRRFGLCTLTLRPCRRECYGEVWPAGWMAVDGLGSGSWPYPTLVGGLWFNLGCGGCVGGCSCATVSEVVVPVPVHDVVEVRVDGVPLVENTDYRVDSFRYLVRLGGASWPSCNDLGLTDAEPGTWSVTVRTGEDVPPLGSMAVGVLASEFTKLLLCNDDCALPRPVQSLVRQGVNVTFLDPNEVFANGRTGLYLPDLFITTYNPDGIRRRARVYDVDRDDSRLTGTG